MQNARWIVKRRHKEGRRNTGAQWQERSIFLKERVKRTLWRVFDKCFEAAPVWGHGSCHTLNSSGRLKSEIHYYCNKGICTHVQQQRDIHLRSYQVTWPLNPTYHSSHRAVNEQTIVQRTTVYETKHYHYHHHHHHHLLYAGYLYVYS